MMRLLWTFLFLLVPLLGTAVFLVAPYFDHWLPESISVEADEVDELFYIILWLTGGVFIITQLALVAFMWLYDGNSPKPKAAKYTHGNTAVEVTWTLVPGFILLFLALYSQNIHEALAINQPPEPDLVVEVTGYQFNWKMRYPGPDGLFDTPDDIHNVSDLHIPVDQQVLIYLKSEDVLHSFFLPNLRLKQDVVPGSKIPVWFTTNKIGTYDLVCAELCGWGHYKMKGRLTVESADDFQNWLKQKAAEQEATQ